MKKVIVLVLLAVVLVVVGTVGYIAIADLPHFDPPTLSLTVESTPERVQRGRQIALMLCAGCHRDPNTGALTGRIMSDAPPEFGTIYSRNITQDKEVGIGSW